MKDYKIFLRQKNETWRQAIDRYNGFLAADMKDYFPEKGYSYHFSDNSSYVYYPMGKISPECLDDFTNKYDVKVPTVLADMLLDYGAFRIGQGGLLEIFDDIGADTILTLPQILSMYGYEDFIGKIGPGMLKSLSHFYFFFGVAFPEAEEITFLYFTKAGNFGKMSFAPNNEALVLQKVLPSMFNGSIDRYSLNELIGNQIDRVIINALIVRGYIE